MTKNISEVETRKLRRHLWIDSSLFSVCSNKNQENLHNHIVKVHPIESFPDMHSIKENLL